MPCRLIPRRVQSVLLVVLLAVLAGGAGVRAASQKKDKSGKAAPQAAAAARTYVGSEACSRCHRAIANNFERTSMGRSLTPLTPEFLKTLPLGPEAGTSYYDARSDHHFEVRAEGGKLVQSEFATKGGQEVFRNAHAMGWIIGTGENGFGALLQRDGYLFQGPLSFYTRAGKWGLSPGYQNEDLGFNRIIQPGCIYCHSGRPQPVAGYAGKYGAFTQTAVGCENCHGPGSAHVEAMGDGQEYEPGRDTTIVNPARLTGQLSDDICMGCHQTGDARVLRPGKTYQDFRPGEPLDKTLSIFQVPVSRENPPQDDHVEHYFSMSMSKCFRASAGKPAAQQMRCITCHDPHVEPTGAEVPVFYNGKCLSCHTTASCTGPRAARQATAPVDNCIGCHMPKRAIMAISHSTATNHRIVARPDEPFPEEAFQQTMAAMPALVHLNAVGVRGPGAAATPALTRLEAYGLLMTARPQYKESWLKVLAELESMDAGNVVVQAALGHRELEAHHLPAAMKHLQQALKLDPLQGPVYLDLAEAAGQSGQAEDAIGYARKAVELDPFVASVRKALIFRLIEAKRYDEATTAMERYVEIFPEDDSMRQMLAIAKAP